MNYLMLLVFSCVVGHATSVANLDKSGVILDGYDTVSYFKGSPPVKGQDKYPTKYNGATYLFANDVNRQEFLKSPAKFEPQFGGWCAFAVADSRSKVQIDPLSYVIQDGRLLLFYNGLWGNTREKWLHGKNKDPQKFLSDADANWPTVKTQEP